MTDDDSWDGEEWERWCALTDAEREAEIEVAEREFSDWFSGLPAAERYRRRVRWALESCTSARRSSAVLPCLREIVLIPAQKRLLALRWERRYGQAGTA